ncbi:uncharacterized protein L201_005749 [Kwoniella dendrophila CBS 6074]|uniref:Uncharacterized protein n=1 Tax=Kwoniella dendrophila CBS 6074 TaxID=1295534 RepID=A0AAX4JZP0_9TREE
MDILNGDMQKLQEQFKLSQQENTSIQNALNDMVKERDLWKTEYYNLKAATKSYVDFQEDEERRKEEAEKLELAQMEKKRKLNESLFSHLTK